MNKKLKDKIKEIPDGIYCYYTHVCPFFTYKLTDFGVGGRKEPAQYCKFLKKYLTIQDMVKDCNVNRKMKDEEDDE